MRAESRGGATSAQELHSAPRVRAWALFLLVLSLGLGWGVSARAQPPESESAGSAAADIVPPKQIHFVQADYPEEARAQGTEATVVLRLSINPTGTVTEALIERSAGARFDEAARRAAMGFRFEPARKDKQPVAAVILYEYRFELEKTAAKSAPPGVAAPPATTGVLVVRVRMDATEIAGATVIVKGVDGTSAAELTDTAGVATFADLRPGTYRVQVQAEGFQPYTHEEQASAGQETRVSYALIPEAEGLEVVVRGEVRRDVSVRKIKQEEFVLVPGGSGDPIRVIESLPGVARSSEGELIIRGASPFFSGVFVDGMAIPFLYHLYQITSVVPADMVEDVTLYPGNYGVRYGRYIGGIVEVGLQSPNTQCEENGKPSQGNDCYHGLAQADIIEGRLALEGPVPLTKHWSFGVSYRRSWLDLVLKQAMKSIDQIELQTAPRYYDGYALLEYNDQGEKLSLRAYGGLDEFKLLMREPGGGDVTTVGRLQFEYGFKRLQALYQKELADDLRYSSMLGVGRDHVTVRFDELELLQRSTPLAFRHEIQVDLLPEVGVILGIDNFVSPYDLRVRIPMTDALTPLEVSEIHGTDATFAAYAELPIQATQRARVVPGVRVDHTPLFDESTASPRVLATYDLVQRPEETWLSRTTAKGGAGLYHQAPPVLIRWFDESSDQQSMRAKQYSLGIEQELHQHLEASVEGFYIDRDRLFSGEGEDDGGTRVRNEGTGNTVGLETFIRYHSDERFFAWLAYTLTRTWERERPGEDRYLSDSDQTHNLVVLGSLDLGRGWRLGARFRYVTGNPVTDIARPPRAQSLFDGSSGQYVPQYTARNAERFPAMHQLDLRADKRWQFPDWGITLYLDVRNATNNRVVDWYAYNYDFTQRAPVSGLPMLPNLGVKGEF